MVDRESVVSDDDDGEWGLGVASVTEGGVGCFFSHTAFILI